MKKWLVLFLMIGFVSNSACAHDTSSESDLRSFANTVFDKVQTRPDCTFTIDVGDFINPKNISEKIKKKNPNLIEKFDVTFHRECAGDPKAELKIMWIVEKNCVAGTLINSKRDVDLDKTVDPSTCTLENYLQLSNTGSFNPWWNLSSEIGLNNSNWR